MASASKTKKKAEKFVVSKKVFTYGGKKKDYERGDYILLPNELVTDYAGEVKDIELHLGTKTYKTNLAWARANWRAVGEGYLVPKTIFTVNGKKRQTK